MSAAGVLVATPKKSKSEQAQEEPSKDVTEQPQKGKPVSTKLYELHAQMLSDLAREESLKGGAAEAFDKHFAPLLVNLLIAAREARTAKLKATSHRAGS